MDHFAGLDVSVKETSVCIVDDTGRLVPEVKVASEPEALLSVLKNPAYHFKRIGLEAGPLSQWLFSALPPGMRIWLIALICVVAALAVDLVWFDGRYSQAALNYFNIRYSGGGGIGISAPNLGHLWRMPYTKSRYPRPICDVAASL